MTRNRGVPVTPRLKVKLEYDPYFAYPDEGDVVFDDEPFDTGTVYLDPDIYL